MSKINQFEISNVASNLNNKNSKLKLKEAEGRKLKKIRTQTNELKAEIQKVNETKSWFFEKINKFEINL